MCEDPAFHSAALVLSGIFWLHQLGLDKAGYTEWEAETCENLLNYGVINTSAGDLSSAACRMITQQAAEGRLAHLSIDDICNVAGGKEWHSNKLEHVWQVGLTLFSVVFHPV